MTNEEVIDFLKSEKEATRELASTCNDKIDYFKKHEEAYDIAIKSLETLETIKEELKAKKNEYSDCGLIGTASGISRSMDTIDKHLSEVSE